MYTSVLFSDLLELEPFLCVMSKDERAAYELALTGAVPAFFSSDQIESWSAALRARDLRIQNRFNDAIKKSMSL